MNREGSGRGTERPRLLSIQWGTGVESTLEVGSRNILAVSPARSRFPDIHCAAPGLRLGPVDSTGHGPSEA